MNPRKFAAALLACAIAGTALASEDSDATKKKEGPEVMEHVEVIGYPTPKVATEESASDEESLAEQMAQQQRQQLLRDTRAAQLRQLEAFRLEGERLSPEEVAQEATDQLEQLEPAELEVDEEASSIEPAQETETDQELLQEPS